MDLFEALDGRPVNLLPYDGTVYYYGVVLGEQESKEIFDRLLCDIEWRFDEADILGQKIVTKRKVAWYGDEPYSYTYSKITKIALPWTALLCELKGVVERETGEVFNSCLLNLYHDGHEGMAWHSDGEKDLRRNGAIASLSFGAERRFSFKHKTTRSSVTKTLQNGSLLVMKGVTQTHWLHRLPQSTQVLKPRISLTFRYIDK